MEKLEGIDLVNADRLISALMTILVQRAGGTAFVEIDEVKRVIDGGVGVRVSHKALEPHIVLKVFSVGRQETVL